MSSRILLISANQCARPEAVFPLGVAHLSAALRQAGHVCAWLDVLIDGEEIGEAVDQYKPDLIGISLRNLDDVLIRKRETFFDVVRRLVAAVRRVNASPIVLGGSGFSLFAQQLMELSGADFGVQGEGESALVRLVDALAGGVSYESIPGLVFRQNGLVRLNPAETECSPSELAEEDRPRRICAYYLASSGTLNIQSQRGCAHRCCYCTYPLLEGTRHRVRPAEAVAAEFEQIQQSGGRYAFIVDSVFNSSANHVAGVCEAMLRRNVKIQWGCFLRPQGLTRDLVKLMARAGLSHVEFGTDSFSDSVLVEYRKGFTFREVLESSELLRQESVAYCHFLIAGGPGETRRTLAEGFENSTQLRDGVVMAVVGMRIYPGTALLRRAIQEGIVAAGADLLSPAYYLAPGLTEEAVFSHLQDCARRSPNWIVGDPPATYASMVQRLRQHGVAGPLWSYFAAIQRLWPQGLSGVNCQ